LFNTFRQYVKTYPNIDPVSYLSELHRYGIIYHQFYNYPPETSEGLFFRRIEVLDTTTIFPLLLQIFDRLNLPKNTNQRQFILADIESFLVRRMICELSTKNYNNLFLEVVKKISEADTEKFGTIIRTHLLS